MLPTFSVLWSVLGIFATVLNALHAQRIDTEKTRSGLWIKEESFPYTGLPYNSVDIVLVGPPPHNFVIECPLSGSPLPAFRWYTDYGSPGQTEVSANMTRYTIDSDGTLHISLNESLEGVATHEWTKCQVCGVFTCVAENEHGKIFWRPVTITTGYIDNFAPGRPDTVKANGTAVLLAEPPRLRPDSVSYLWTKGPVKAVPEYLRDDDDDHMFLSKATGNLYFSQLRPSDAGEYRVLVLLEDRPHQRVVGPYDGHTSGRYMYDGRVVTSPPVRLVVESLDVGYAGPEIDADFPAIVPQQPQRGRDFQLECFAYGRLPLFYTWSKDGKDLNTTSRGNRVLHIYRARFEDSGTYTCHVHGGGPVIVSRSVIVNLVSPPKAKRNSPLGDTSFEKGSNHTWVCDSEAVPAANYTWYRNTLPLDTNSIDGITVGPSNTLHISNADAATHNGMYECMAVNPFGKMVYATPLNVLFSTTVDPLVG